MTDNRNPDDSRVERLSRLVGKMTARGEADDDVVQQYEERYAPKRKRGDLPRSYSTGATEEERRAAALAHGSAWGALLLFPLTIFIPLLVYLRYRKESPYVAFHALQAFALQALGTLGALAVLVIGVIVWSLGMAVAALLVVVGIGLLLVPLWALVGVVLLLVPLAMPLAMLLFATMGAYETYHGRDFRYPYVARWIDRQLTGDVVKA